MSSPQIFVMSSGEADLVAASGHPNEMKFRGVLVRLDEPSTKAPNGSEGHRIMVPSAVAKKKLSTLLNMGLNYAPDMKHHAQRRKIGVITKAWIDGRDVRVEATVWKHDFPEAIRDLKRSGLGMSMELGEVQIKDSSANVWELSDFTFLGATVLERSSAAYSRTHAIAAAKEKKQMPVQTKKKVAVPGIGSAAVLKREIVEIAAAAATEAITQIVGPVMQTQARILSRLDAMDVEAEDVEVEVKAETDETDERKIAAKFGEEDDEEGDDEETDDMESEVDKGDLEEMGPERDEGELKPGHQNREAKNKGRQTTVENKVGTTVDSSAIRLAASLSREKKLKKQNAEITTANENLEKRMKRLEKQVTIAAESQSRRSTILPSEVTGLLRKSGLDPGELVASGSKLSVEDVDGMFQAVGGIAVEKRMQLKGEMVRHGIMDEGRVSR